MRSGSPILIERHQLLTRVPERGCFSKTGTSTVRAFVKVTPKDYQRALLELKAEREAAQMAAAE
jgi:glutamate synthase (NADPH/NADH) large chain